MNKRLCAWLALLPPLLLAFATLAADTKVPSVDPPRLEAFMEKWRTCSIYEYPKKPADWPLLLEFLLLLSGWYRMRMRAHVLESAGKG